LSALLLKYRVAAPCDEQGNPVEQDPTIVGGMALRLDPDVVVHLEPR
jgi:hypothetical protein